MPGETEDKPTGWTVDTSRYDILARLDAMDRRYEQRFGSQEKAIEKAEAAVDKRFDEVREKFIPPLMTRSETLALLDAINQRMSAVDDRTKETVVRRKGLSEMWQLVAGAVALAGIVIGIILAFN